MRHHVTIAAATIVMLAGCAKQNAAPQDVSPPPPSARAPSPSGATANGRMVVGQNGTQGELVGTPARGSKFSRVEIGMTQREVESIIGPPTDVDSHITGKAFIPFYFGGDTMRMETFYKGEGILTFAPSHFAGQANTLVRIIADPSERGYAH